METMFSLTPWALRVRGCCQLSTESRRTRFITSFINCDVSCRPSLCVDIISARWHHVFARTGSISSSRQLLLQQLPTLQDSSRRLHSGKSGARSKKQGYNQIRYSECKDIDEVLRLATRNLDDQLPSAAVWSSLSKLLTRQNRYAVTGGNMARDKALHALLQHTMNKIGENKPKELTAITLSMAKITKNVQQAKQQRRMNTYQQSFSNVLVDKKEVIFNHCAKSANGLMGSFDARYLSNLAYAYAFLGQNPIVEDDRTILDLIADQSIGCLGQFDPQGFANTVWAYATANVQHCRLFETFGDHIAQFGDLYSFKPQALANIAWAYASSNQRHPTMFRKIGDHIAEMDDLHSFQPQHLANISWAYAKVNLLHQALFQKIGDFVAVSNDLHSFQPQNLANIVWAYATAGVQHPALFKKISDIIVALDGSKPFSTQALASIVWAYAKANQRHPVLFKKIGNSIAALNDFTLFQPQALANIAWAYAISDVDVPLLFNDGFTNELLDRRNDFNIIGLTQLHQWHIWQTLKSNPGLPEPLREMCNSACMRSKQSGSP